MRKHCDTVIVGGGPAGVSAALVLGRCLRTVTIFDSVTPRNYSATAMYGFLSRDGMSPQDLRDTARAQLSSYPNVEYFEGEVNDIQKCGNGFKVCLSSREVIECRTVLLATGIMDELPDIPGFAEYFGASVHSCPYCHGWEERGKNIVVYGSGSGGFNLTKTLTAWTNSLTLCTDGKSNLSTGQKQILSRKKIGLREERIHRLVGSESHLREIQFVGGEPLKCDALFFNMPTTQQSWLGSRMGCEFNKKLGIKCDSFGRTTVKGMYAAGNTIKGFGLAIEAAAEGAKAAYAINNDLTDIDFKNPSTNIYSLNPVESDLSGTRSLSS